jgi:periplasmic copper chaperone A
MKILMTLLMALLLASCSGERLEIEDSRVRASIPGRLMTVAYLSLRNNGAETCVLRGVTSDSAGLIEVHQHLHLDGRMAMREVDNFSIDPGEKVTFEPGGLHLMVMQLSHPLTADETLSVRFDFGGCGVVDHAFPVVPLS